MEDSANSITISHFTTIGINSINEAKNYLRDISNDKEPSQRVVSWLLALDLLKGDLNTWPKQFSNIYTTYKQRLNHYCPEDTINSVEEISKNLESIIPRDLKRSIGVYEKSLQEIQLDSSLFSNYFFKFHRIFLIMSKESSDYQYIQGQDRYLYFIIIFVTQFFERLEISDQLWIESISSSIFQAFCEKIPYDKIVLDPSEMRDLFSRLSDFIAEKDPKLSKNVTIKPDQYALNWFLSLFSEQHSNPESLVIFDHLLLHLEDLDEYMFSLSLAHLKQVGSVSFQNITNLLNKRIWDMKAIFSIADNLSSSEIVDSQNSKEKICTVLLVALASLSLFLICHGVYRYLKE